MVSQSDKLTSAGYCLLFQANFNIGEGEDGIRERESNMVKLWFVYDCCHDSIKNMFFVVGNRQYQKFSHIVRLLVKCKVLIPKIIDRILRHYFFS